MKIRLAVIVFVVFTMSCKTYYEKVNPEYPNDVYEFVAQQLGKEILDDFCKSCKNSCFFELMLSIDSNEIVSATVLSKTLDTAIIVRIEEALVNKEMTFEKPIESESNRYTISGLIKKRKLCRIIN